MFPQVIHAPSGGTPRPRHPRRPAHLPHITFTSQIRTWHRKTTGSVFRFQWNKCKWIIESLCENCNLNIHGEFVCVELKEGDGIHHFLLPEFEFFCNLKDIQVGNVPELRIISSSCFFHHTISPEPQDFSFTVINDKTKQQILTFKKLNPANVRHLCLKND